MTDRLKGICRKCTHREVCDTSGRPCKFVELYLSYADDTVYMDEKTSRKAEKVVTIVSKFNNREKNETSLLAHFENPGEENREEIFSTEAEKAFSGFDPELQKTGVFVDRWCGWSYEDIAMKYSLSYQTARKTYHSAKSRLLEVVKAMDEGLPQKLSPWRERIQKKSGHLPDSHRWFLMSKAFGLLPVEICRLEGLKSSTPVYKAIQYISDRIMAGELVLINPTEQEKAEAKERLEAARRRDREYRARNLERERAKDRERYTRKKAASKC